MLRAVDKFFTTHLLGPEYFAFPADERAKALTRARGDLKRELGRAPDTKRPGEFAALCEQTLAVLLNGRTAGISPRGRRCLRDAATTDGVQECFGSCRHDEECRNCELLSSCAYITGADDPDKHSGMTSIEEIEKWSIETAVYDSLHEDEEEEPPEETPFDLGSLMEFCRFLFSLDDYTLAILAECLNPRGDARMADNTVSSLARIHGVSRQAMHRKMLASVRRHPELASVFRLVLRKIGRARIWFPAVREA